MQYKQIILDFITNDDMPGFHSWVQSQPIIEQPDIMRTFKELILDLAAERGIEMPMEQIEELDAINDRHEEIILDEQVISLKIDVVNKQRQEVLERLKKNADTTRLHIKHSLETDAPNAREMYILALKMINIEKKEGYFDAANWEWFQI